MIIIFFNYCFILCFSLIILFLLPSDNIAFFLIRVCISYYIQVYLHCTNVILLCGLEILFRVLFVEMIGSGNEHPVGSAG